MPDHPPCAWLTCRCRPPSQPDQLTLRGIGRRRASSRKRSFACYSWGEGRQRCLCASRNVVDRSLRGEAVIRRIAAAAAAAGVIALGVAVPSASASAQALSCRTSTGSTGGWAECTGSGTWRVVSDCWGPTRRLVTRAAAIVSIINPSVGSDFGGDGARHHPQ